MMGTNYYAYTDTCPHCGRSDEEVHIGKSSIGWAFSLRVYPENSSLPQNWSEWVAYLNDKGVTIEDEYGDDVTFEELKSVIFDRKRDGEDPKRLLELEESMAPYCKADLVNGLLRHITPERQDFDASVTYDLSPYEFS